MEKLMTRLLVVFGLLGVTCGTVVWAYSTFPVIARVDELREDIKEIRSDVKTLLAR